MRVPQSVLAPRLVAELAVVGPGSHPGQGQCVNDPDGRNHGEYRGNPPVSPHRAPGNHQRGGSSRNGGTTTTQHARTRAWMGSHPTSLQPAPIGAIT